MKSILSFAANFVFSLLFAAVPIAAGGTDYTGQFEPSLVPNTEDFEKVILKFTNSIKVGGQPVSRQDEHYAAGRLIDPRTLEYTVLSLLVESGDENPVLYVDRNGDNSLSGDEKYVLKQSKNDNPYLWETVIEIDLKEGAFKTFPLYVRYFKSIRSEKMGPDDRMITQSTQAVARGQVDVRDKKVLVQYAYDAKTRKIDPQNGLVGVDIDGDGRIDMDTLSPESTKADNETLVFRAGELFVSTKKTDLSKNVIVLRENDAKDYKRQELFLGREFPEFGFTDFDGKKHKISEYRGHYVLLDIWGFWCPACRTELPYLREAFRRFKARNLVVLGLNTDPDYTIDSMKKSLNENGMNWTHAQFASVVDFLSKGLRVNSFPTTFLISPEGKILSMGRAEHDEPDLRGQDLLETLDGLLPNI